MIAAALLWFPLSLPGAAGLAPDAWLSYSIDRSSVPEWVIFPAVTLRVHVGSVQSIEAYSDGRLVPVRYESGGGGYAIVTIEGARLDLRLVGPQSPIEELGQWSVSKLRDDKRWAYSLTLDDAWKSVWDNAKAYLDRLGQRAGVAVIARWLYGEELAPPEPGTPYWCGAPAAYLQPGFDLDNWMSAAPECTHSAENSQMTPAQLREIQSAGWSLFNHTYSHYTAGSLAGQELRDIRAANLAIERLIPGYRTTVFTIPSTVETWKPVAMNNVDLLGLRLIQYGGSDWMQVDSQVPLNTAWVVTRRDVGGFDSLMQNIHNVAVGSPNNHYWLLLHAHKVDPVLPGNPESDWVWLAADTVQFAYGPGGFDEVWIAPADEVFHYLVVRDQVSISRPPTNQPPAVLQSAPIVQRLVLRNQDGKPPVMWDVMISSVPGETRLNFNQPGLNYLKFSGNPAKTVLFRFDLSSVPQDAKILRATLGVHVQGNSNSGPVKIRPYRLLHGWLDSEATWEESARGVRWLVFGANAVGGDRDAVFADDRSFRCVLTLPTVERYPRSNTCQNVGGWYSVDLTSLVQGWVQTPETNFGTVIRTEGDGAVTVDANSSDYVRWDQRPSLIVEYVLPSPLPSAAPPPGSQPSDGPGRSQPQRPILFRASVPAPADPIKPAIVPWGEPTLGK